MAGQIDLLKAEEGIQWSLVSRIDFNPYYDPSFLSDDLCLLQVGIYGVEVSSTWKKLVSYLLFYASNLIFQVANPFHWTDTVQPAALPEFHTPNPVNLTGIVTGWDIQDVSSTNKKWTCQFIIFLSLIPTVWR